MCIRDSSTIVPTLLWANLTNVYIWIALLGFVAFGAIGFIDDYAKVTHKRNLGLLSLIHISRWARR